MPADPDILLREAAASPRRPLDLDALVAVRDRRQTRRRRSGFAVVLVVVVAAGGSLASLAAGPGGPAVADAPSTLDVQLDAPALLAEGPTWDVVAHLDPDLRIEVRDGWGRRVGMGGSVVTGPITAGAGLDDAAVIAPDDGVVTVVAGALPDGAEAVAALVDGTAVEASGAVVEDRHVFVVVVEEGMTLEALVATGADGTEVDRRLIGAPLRPRFDGAQGFEDAPEFDDAPEVGRPLRDPDDPGRTAVIEYRGVQVFDGERSESAAAQLLTAGWGRWVHIDGSGSWNGFINGDLVSGRVEGPWAEDPTALVRDVIAVESSGSRAIDPETGEETEMPVETTFAPGALMNPRAAWVADERYVEWTDEEVVIGLVAEVLGVELRAAGELVEVLAAQTGRPADELRSVAVAPVDCADCGPRIAVWDEGLDLPLLAIDASPSGIDAMVVTAVEPDAPDAAAALAAVADVVDAASSDTP